MTVLVIPAILGALTLTLVRWERVHNLRATTLWTTLPPLILTCVAAILHAADATATLPPVLQRILLPLSTNPNLPLLFTISALGTITVLITWADQDFKSAFGYILILATQTTLFLTLTLEDTSRFTQPTLLTALITFLLLSHAYGKHPLDRPFMAQLVTTCAILAALAFFYTLPAHALARLFAPHHQHLLIVSHGATLVLLLCPPPLPTGLHAAIAWTPFGIRGLLLAVQITFVLINAHAISLLNLPTLSLALTTLLLLAAAAQAARLAWQHTTMQNCYAMACNSKFLLLAAVLVALPPHAPPALPALLTGFTLASALACGYLCELWHKCLKNNNTPAAIPVLSACILPLWVVLPGTHLLTNFSVLLGPWSFIAFLLLPLSLWPLLNPLVHACAAPDTTTSPFRVRRLLISAAFLLCCAVLWIVPFHHHHPTP